jgi:hypothetical protein
MATSAASLGTARMVSSTAIANGVIAASRTCSSARMKKRFTHGM